MCRRKRVRYLCLVSCQLSTVQAGPTHCTPKPQLPGDRDGELKMPHRIPKSSRETGLAGGTRGSLGKAVKRASALRLPHPQTTLLFRNPLGLTPGKVFCSCSAVWALMAESLAQYVRNAQPAAGTAKRGVRRAIAGAQTPRSSQVPASDPGTTTTEAVPADLRPTWLLDGERGRGLLIKGANVR